MLRAEYSRPITGVTSSNLNLPSSAPDFCSGEGKILGSDAMLKELASCKFKTNIFLKVDDIGYCALHAVELFHTYVSRSRQLAIVFVTSTLVGEARNVGA